MTLENTLLEKLSEWQPAPGRQNLLVNAGGWTATVMADRSDAVGCLVWELHLQRERAGGLDVSAWADAAVKNVTGLLQSLTIVEIDAVRREAQLRGDAPQKQDGKGLYHELLLSGSGHAILRRFRIANGGTSREQVTFAITNETLARLASQLSVVEQQQPKPAN